MSNFRFTYIDLDEFEICRAIGQTGDTLTLHYDQDVPRALHPRVSITIKGSRLLSSSDGLSMIRGVGAFSSDAPDMKAGVTYVYTALEDSEFICVGRKDGAPLSFTKVLAQAGETITLQEGRRLLVALGKTNRGDAPLIVVAPAPHDEIQVIEDVTGMVF
jgi:hypothetical protein